MSLEEIYKRKCEEPSDINEHLPTLKRYAEKSEHITEMGVRWIVSTYALLMGKPKRMISWDIMPVDVSHIKTDTDFEFRLGNTLEIDIEETDFLFIDTLHNYDQLKAELDRHANKVRKWIAFHDTTSFEWHGESYRGKAEKGIWPAIEEFLTDNAEWKLVERFTNNNGLTIIGRSNFDRAS